MSTFAYNSDRMEYYIKSKKRN